MLSARNILHPYGADVTIEKWECINHMSKRMFKGLEKVVKESSINHRSVVGRKIGRHCPAGRLRWAEYSAQRVHMFSLIYSAENVTVIGVLFAYISSFAIGPFKFIFVFSLYNRQPIKTEDSKRPPFLILMVHFDPPLLFLDSHFARLFYVISVVLFSVNTNNVG